MNAAKKVCKSNVVLVFDTASNNRKRQIQTLKQMIINYTFWLCWYYERILLIKAITWHSLNRNSLNYLSLYFSSC